MVEWNGIFRLFRFSGILGQPREVHPKFRNEIPENVCSIPALPNPEFPEFLVEWKAPPVFEISKIEIKSEECAQEIRSYFIWFTQQMKVIINCGKPDILKSKQVVSLAKRISNKFFQCPQASPPASTRSL